MGSDEPCWLNGVSMHPRWPVLATTGSSSDDEQGQLVLWDTSRGAPLSTLAIDGGAGWSETSTRDQVRWRSHDAALLLTHSTNGIMVVKDGAIVGTINPDDTRDHPVEFCWVGDQVFSPACGGILTEPVPGENLFEDDLSFLETELRHELRGVEYNEELRAVIGYTHDSLIALDPHRPRILEQLALPQPLRGDSCPVVSPDGRWFAVKDGHPVPRGRPQRSTITAFDTTKGQRAYQLELDGARRMRWGPDGQLVVLISDRSVHRGESTHLAVVRDGAVERTIDFARPSGALPDVTGCDQLAWSPSGDALALWLGDAVRIVDVATGATRASFPAVPPACPPCPVWKDPRREVAGILWVDADRLVTIGTHFTAWWSARGEKLAEHVVPL